MSLANIRPPRRARNARGPSGLLVVRALVQAELGIPDPCRARYASHWVILRGHASNDSAYMSAMSGSRFECRQARVRIEKPELRHHASRQSWRHS
jgi:hypothetical protein